MLRITLWLYALLYILALSAFLLGQFGWLGTERDPLAGIYLLPLGLPWILFVDWLPDVLWPGLGATMPLVNLALLGWWSRHTKRSPQPPAQA